jgi:hypothetical protein
VALVTAAIVGCAPTGQEAEAEDAVRAELQSSAGYDTDEISCTGNPVLAPGRVELTYCVVRRVEGGCDRFRVEFLSGDRTRVRLDRRDTGCVLPD